ncbi:MAG TPA: hypothetical protein VEH84_11345 [Alphaproteobacteria bacterium]|nr:hypothetical protein [Alphaproteobacteria bacterium]
MDLVAAIVAGPRQAGCAALLRADLARLHPGLPVATVGLDGRGAGDGPAPDLSDLAPLTALNDDASLAAVLRAALAARLLERHERVLLLDPTLQLLAPLTPLLDSPAPLAAPPFPAPAGGEGPEEAGDWAGAAPLDPAALRLDRRAAPAAAAWAESLARLAAAGGLDGLAMPDHCGLAAFAAAAGGAACGPPAASAAHLPDDPAAAPLVQWRGLLPWAGRLSRRRAENRSHARLGAFGPLADAYQAAFAAAGGRAGLDAPPARLPDGRPLGPALRRLLAEAARAGAADPAALPPEAVDPPLSAPGEPPLTRLMQILREDDPGLGRRFPDDPAGRLDFACWFAAHGAPLGLPAAHVGPVRRALEGAPGLLPPALLWLRRQRPDLCARFGDGPEGRDAYAFWLAEGGDRYNAEDEPEPAVWWVAAAGDLGPAVDPALFEAFYDRLCAPAACAAPGDPAPLPEFLALWRRLRPDLAADYDTARPAGRRDLLRWFLEAGCAETALAAPLRRRLLAGLAAAMPEYARLGLRPGAAAPGWPRRGFRLAWRCRWALRRGAGR